jgi:hypothetical protein
MLAQLLNTYANTATQHNSTAKANYYAFNANKAYVQHTVALMQLQQHYAAQAHNTTACTCTAHICKCATAFNLQHSINAAILVAQRKQAYAQTHVNFNLQAALTVIAAYKRAA